ncbi:MAG: hypothetical protein LUF28_07705 [Clostridiales bacterium]|nr:hypothetical protein [Clostridiales bacterium]
MVKTKAKRLLSLLLAFAMVMSLTVTPVYAADDDDTSDGSGTSETGGTSSTSAGTFSEPEAAEAEAVAAVEDEAEAEDEELVIVDEEEEANYGIAAIAEEAAVATVSGTSYTDLTTAISEASENNSTVTMAADVVLTAGITISSGSVILDLNGCSIIRAETYNETYLINVASGASLTLNDTAGGGKLSSTYVSSEDGYTCRANAAIMAAGNVTVSAGTVNGYYGIYINGSNAVVAVSGGTVTGYRAIYGNAGTLNVSGGTVSGYYDGVYATGTSSSVTISGRDTVVKSTATSEEATSTAVIAIWYGATVTVKSGTVTGGYCGVGIYKHSSDSTDTTTRNTLNVEGGSISGLVFGISTNGSNYNTDISISGGEITGKTAMYLPAMNSTTTINGGTITGENTGIEIRAGSLTVSGGTIIAKGTPGSTTREPLI